MAFPKKAAAGVLIASVVALAGCTYDGGYGGVNVGYGVGYSGYDYPYGYEPYGWYDGYYYPGSGYWIYDRGGSRHRWSDRHRGYWEQRRAHTGNWNGPSTRPWRPEYRNEAKRPDRRRNRSGAGAVAQPQQRPARVQRQRTEPAVNREPSTDAPSPVPVEARPRRQRGGDRRAD